MTSASVPDGSVERPFPRLAARVVLLDGQGRVLLLRGVDPAVPGSRYWFTVGGGLDDGETSVQAAVRELREETGLSVTEERLEGPVWHQTADVPFSGRWYRQEQDFYVTRVEDVEVSLDGLDPDEREAIDDHRWWSASDLLATRERYYPTELPVLLNEILGS